MKIAIVVQRYGSQIIGGAEGHARQVAEKLADSDALDIDVYTTTAVEYQCWSNVLTPGVQTTGSVSIRRFCSQFPRNRVLFALWNRLFVGLLRARWWRSVPGLRQGISWIERIWYVLQGPYCPRLIAELDKNAHQYEKVLFFTYLYYPCAFGASRIGARAVLIPTAHDEAPFYFAQTEQLFARVGAILANTRAEADLITQTYPSTAKKLAIAGMGLDHLRSEYEHCVQQGAGRLRIPRGGHLIYLGRICKGKGTQHLARQFMRYVEATGSRLHLFFAGKKESVFELPSHPQISYLGVLSDEEKWQFLTSALAVVNPSPRESLSLLVLEGMLARTAVIVNTRDPVLASYASEHSSVFGYRNTLELETILDYLSSNEWRQEGGAALQTAAKWVEQTYSWQRVLGMYRWAIVGPVRASSPELSDDLAEPWQLHTALPAAIN